jgi:hypothetical protein
VSSASTARPSPAGVPTAVPTAVPSALPSAVPGTVPAALAAVAGPTGEPVGARRQRRHVLVVAVAKRRGRALLEDIRYVLDTGSRVTLMCTRASDWPELEGQVDFCELETAEGRHLLLRVERALLFTAPNLLLRRAAGVFRRAGRLPRADAAVRAATRTERVRRRYNDLGQAAHNRLFMRGYRVIRPWVLWRSARTAVLPELDPASIDLLLLADAQAVAIGWHLAKAHPDLLVTSTLDRSALPPVLT